MKLKKSKVVFDPLPHIYLDERGNELPGVTSLLKKHGLSPDYSNIPEATLKAAADRGTAIHELCEAYDNGDTMPEDSPYAKELAAYIAKCGTEGLKIHCSEYLISNDVCASSIDKVCTDGSLIDLKTSAEIHRSYTWQLSIYKHMFEAMNPKVKVPHLYIMHLRDGKAELIEVEPIPAEQVEALMECERKGEIYHEPMPEGIGEEQQERILALLNRKAELEAELADIKIGLEIETATLMEYAEAMTAAEKKLPAVGSYTMVYKRGSIRESVSAADLKKADAELYVKLVKQTAIKPSISFTLKKEK